MVLDASVFASWVLPTQRTDAATALLTTAAEHRFLVPHIFPVEVRNILLAAERRNKWRIAETEEALELLSHLNIALFEPLHSPGLDEAMRAARAERLSMYDGLYLALADENYAILASRDKALLNAARQRNISVYDAGEQ